MRKLWEESESDLPGYLNQITGSSGAIYPPAFLEYLRDARDGFRSVCPTSDDIWLTANALRSDFKIAQIGKESKIFKTIPGTQANSLFLENVIEGKNHHQFIETFSAEDMDKLTREMNGRKTDYFTLQNHPLLHKPRLKRIVLL